jgi:hypothetical protein
MGDVKPLLSNNYPKKQNIIEQKTTNFFNYPKNVNDLVSLEDKVKKNARYQNTASWERIEGPRQIPMSIKVEGSNNFKLGEDQIDSKAQGVINAVFEIQKISQSGGGEVTVNGSSSNTNWGNFKAGSSEAIKKNTELASKRRDNMIKYLKSLNIPNMTFKKGTATVGDSDNKEKDQNVNMDISGSKSIDVEAKGDIGDNTRTSPKIYDKNPSKQNKITPTPQPIDIKQIRIATKVPSKHVDELEKLIINWGESKNINLGVANEYKYKISISKK